MSKAKAQYHDKTYANAVDVDGKLYYLVESSTDITQKQFTKRNLKLHKALKKGNARLVTFKLTK